MYINGMIQEEPQKPLTVYSASAGSGKTFSLVQEYLGLTIANEKGPGAFKHVIAMTFTNKAAWEMKSRIIDALDKLSNINSLEGGAKSKADNILRESVKNTGLSESEIIRRSQRTLSEILHNYEEFHVMTIDKFSLRLIRTFNKDLDLPEDFEVVLDEKEILEQVVDELLSKVGKPGYERVTDLTLKYAKTNLEEGNKWNFRKKLIDFAEVLTKETEQEYIHKLLEKEFSGDDYDRIITQRKQVEQQYETAKTALHDYFVSLQSSPSDYPQGKRGFYGQLDELPTRQLGNLKPIRKYTLQTLSGEIVKEKHTIDAALLSKTAAFLKRESELADQYYFYSTQYKNFFDMALLKYLYEEFSAYKERNNVIGISEFGTMIAQLLNKESALYVYERLGTRFHHFLLDEFQDTSRLQWLNLIPLLEDSIANNRKNLIVGDPKQAIYRFRNGLVEQFVALPGIYNPDKDPVIGRISQQFERMGRKLPLDDNYRSKKEVVTFNNAFFKTLVNQLPQHFAEYYASIRQNPKGDEGGYVSIERYSGTSENEYKSLIDPFVLEKVRKCISDGYAPGDICILVKRKKEAQRLAQMLSSCEEQFKVISADSLSVDSDKTVQLYIDYFKLRRNSSNKTAQMKFATSYFRAKGKDPIVALQPFWKDGKIGRFDQEAFVNNQFGSSEVLFVDYENMYDLGQKFTLLMRFNILRNPYLHHFMEILQQFDLRFGPDLRSFLDHWESKAHKENIQLPDNSEAIKLMTIHKSKGLEFPVVIVPDLTWAIEPHRRSEFFEVDNELLRVNLKGSNVPDYVEQSYIQEYEQILLDQLNLLYVAFTRAEDRLYAFTDQKGMSKTSDRFTKLSQLINVGISSVFNELGIRNEDEAHLKYGEEHIIERENVGADGFIPEELHDFLWFPEISLQDDELKEQEVLSDDQLFGNQLHLVLSKIETEDQLDRVINDLKKEDLIDQKYVADIRKKVISIFELEPFQQLLQDAEKTYNEQDILIDETHVKRPDKLIQKRNGFIVIDYKTGKPLKKHERQVLNYCQVLKQMGADEVEGYLLYTHDLTLKKVS